VKIGFSTSVIQRGKTGIAQYVFALLRQLSRPESGVDLTVFALEEDLEHFQFLAGKARLVTVSEQHRAPVKNILWHQQTLPGLARRHQLDVLHVPSYRRLLWRRPCPLVATIHDLAPFHVQGKYDWKRMLYGRVIVRQLARRQDHIIAISENTARDIRTFFGVAASKMTVVHNGLDHARFFPVEPEKARAIAAERWGLSAPFFLYVSRLEHPAKNHVRLIEAFSRFKRETGSEWQLAFGGSDWHGSEAIHAAARKSSCAKDIRFLGFVADPDLPSLYQAAGAFCYPSLYEGFGFPPVEAMACGCPVISSRAGALDEVVAQAAATVDPQNTAGIQQALARMATDPGWRKAWVARGLLNARRFDWDQAARGTVEVYRRAVSSSVPNRLAPAL